MINKGKSQEREELLKSILEGYVRSDFGGRSPEGSAHLDEDSISAFVEGNLSGTEAAPMTSHLVACSFCRHKTAELVRLDSQFAEESETPAASTEPSKVSDVLSGILGKLFGASEGAVFAHNEDESEEKEEDEEPE